MLVAMWGHTGRWETGNTKCADYLQLLGHCLNEAVHPQDCSLLSLEYLECGRESIFSDTEGTLKKIDVEVERLMHGEKPRRPPGVSEADYEILKKAYDMEVPDL